MQFYWKHTKVYSNVYGVLITKQLRLVIACYREKERKLL